VYGYHLRNYDYYNSVNIMAGRKELRSKGIHLSYDMWMEYDGGEKVLTGEELSMLLEIDKTGSLLQASTNLNVSYRKAWGLVRKIEKQFGFQILSRSKESQPAGRNEITLKGMELMNAWKSLHYEADIAMKSITNVFFRRIEDIYEDK